MKFETPLDFFIVFIILIKIIFVLSAVGHLLLSHSGNYFLSNKVDPQLIYWKERTEFIFIASMSILLIYQFRPGKNKPVDQETSLLFFLFGWVLLVTAKWNLFFAEASWYKRIANALK
jgi:hypothetical protein